MQRPGRTLRSSFFRCSRRTWKSRQMSMAATATLRTRKKLKDRQNITEEVPSNGASRWSQPAACS